MVKVTRQSRMPTAGLLSIQIPCWVFRSKHFHWWGCDVGLFEPICLVSERPSVQSWPSFAHGNQIFWSPRPGRGAKPGIFWFPFIFSINCNCCPHPLKNSKDKDVLFCQRCFLPNMPKSAQLSIHFLLRKINCVALAWGVLLRIND